MGVNCIGVNLKDVVNFMGVYCIGVNFKDVNFIGVGHVCAWGVSVAGKRACMVCGWIKLNVFFFFALNWVYGL